MLSNITPLWLRVSGIAKCGLLFALFGPLIFEGAIFKLEWGRFLAQQLILPHFFAAPPSLATGLCVAALDRHVPLRRGWTLLAMPIGVLVFWLTAHVAAWIAGNPQAEGLPWVYHSRPWEYLGWAAVMAFCCTWAAHWAGLLSKSD